MARVQNTTPKFLNRSNIGCVKKRKALGKPAFWLKARKDEGFPVLVPGSGSRNRKICFASSGSLGHRLQQRSGRQTHQAHQHGASSINITTVIEMRLDSYLR
mgnify:CR=1 FL=1